MRIFAICGLTAGLILLSISPAFAEETKTIFVGPSLVECVGVGLQQCMQVRDDPSSSWQFFYDKIEGFDFEQGFEYELLVKITDVKNPPADASSKKYELIEISSKKPLSSLHFPYQGVCAPGFVPLGEICVLNDRCGPGVYPGKICIMDGKTQPYLRPLLQGNAGISARNVICAEGLELIFKSHDGSPSCVNPSSVSKLQENGWQKHFPSFACTLEYAPICGIDRKTYGNMCMINAEHVAIKYQGECDE